jgi:hypothetical protein
MNIPLCGRKKRGKLKGADDEQGNICTIRKSICMLQDCQNSFFFLFLFFEHPKEWNFENNPLED